MLKVNLGSFGAFPISKPCISKRDGCRAKRSEIWVLGVEYSVYTGYICIQGTFLTLTSKWLRSFLDHWVHFWFWQACVSRKRLVVDRNRVKFGPRWWVFSVHRVRLTLTWLRSFWGHWCISDLRQPCLSKTSGRRAKWSEIWALGGCIHCIQGSFNS